MRPNGQISEIPGHALGGAAGVLVRQTLDRERALLGHCNVMNKNTTADAREVICM